jgi:hypothetical protein
MLKTIGILSACVSVVMLAADLRASEPEGAPLFNGQDLSGWGFIGDPGAWGVVEGELRVVNPGRFGWIRTEKMYRDFELSVEFFLEEGTNSGVGLRCAGDGDPAFTGMEIQIYDNHGDAPEKSSCGAVYNAIAPRLQAVRAPGDWNAYRIVLVGERLNAWLNGEHILIDEALDDRGIFRREDQPMPLRDRLTTGYIAFQAHGEPGLRLRNITVKDLSPDPDPGDFRPAFVNEASGAEIEGWTPRGGGTWTVSGTTLTGENGPGHLFSDATHTDIEIRASVRVNTRGNSGVYFRTVPRPEDPDTWPLGYEAQVDNHDPKNFTGCVYDRAWARVEKPITRDNAWFDYRIVARGDRVRTWVNGRPMVDAVLTDFSGGHLAFQTHHPLNKIEYRDVRWRVPGDDE